MEKLEWNKEKDLLLLTQWWFLSDKKGFLSLLFLLDSSEQEP